MTDFEPVPLSVFDQTPTLQGLYTQLCFCFPHGTDPATTDPPPSLSLESLEIALRKLTSAFPWLAGRTARERADEGVKIVPYRPIPLLNLVRHDDTSNEGTLPSYEDLRRAKFPMRLLDENKVTSLPTLGPLTGNYDEVVPVFTIQINQLKGGVVVCFGAAHNVMDMTGLAQVISLFNRCCRGESITAEEMTEGNSDRRNILSWLEDTDTETLRQKYKHQIVEAPSPAKTETQIESAAESAPQSPATKCAWSYWSFSADGIAKLKNEAMQTLPKSSDVTFISMDDAITAQIFKSVLRARANRLPSDAEVKLSRAFDPRSPLGLPPTWPGNIGNHVYTAMPLSRLVEIPIGEVAAQLRSALVPDKMAYDTRALATLARDKVDANVMATMELTKDITISSWAKESRMWNCDFGLGLGPPEAVRRPKFMEVEGLFYLMPRRPDGEISAALCLRAEDERRLREDDGFAKYADYVG